MFGMKLPTGFQLIGQVVGVCYQLLSFMLPSKITMKSYECINWGFSLSGKYLPSFLT